MKISKFMRVLLAASLAMGMTSCAESTSDNKDPATPPEPTPGNKCQVSVCQDANVLNFCDPVSGNLIVMPCQYGCDEATKLCKSAPDASKCTADSCKNDNVLLKCDNATGVYSEITCQNGCDWDAKVCKNEADKCTADVCKDENTLIKCNPDGTTSDEFCQSGCDMDANVCKSVDEKCSADVCKNENTLLKCNEDGSVSEEVCPNGCDQSTNACEPASEKCEADVCKDDDVLLKCNAKDGTTSEETCPNGCNKKTNACRKTPICTANACKDDKKTLLVCDTELGESSEKVCDAKCLDNDCRDADYCASSEDCTEEGKNFCNKNTHRCTDMACASADCADSETCVLGICVPDADLNAEDRSVCSKDAFVDHCRGKQLVFCENQNGVDYKVRVSNCSGKFSGDYYYGGCRAYKDGTDIEVTCVLDEKPEDICGSAPSKSVCDPEWKIVTNYICTTSTNAEPIVIAQDTTETCE